MSKKITHEQARESIEMVDGSFFPAEKEALLAYIEQQEELEKEYNTYVKHLKLVELHSNSKDEIIEKQQKLLELYKEALEINFEGITLIKLVNKTLRTQIKEIENE